MTEATRTIDRRPPETVMRLSRLGSFHQSRLSFMRILTRRMAADNWTFSRPIFEISDDGVGHAVYCAHAPDRTYSLVAFSHDLPDSLRSDRVIAEAWDATFALFDGIPTAQDIERLSQNVPLQEAGRISERELCLSRANRSARLWAHAVSALANGVQPDADQLAAVGYLMRTTAVYGSGKFGAADRETICERPEMQPPFQAEMLSVYLTRVFVRDLVNHMAAESGGMSAVALDAQSARNLGIGNSTGLGMAPFLINHPILFNNWIMAREEAIARVRGVQFASADALDMFQSLLARSMNLIKGWRSAHPVQSAKIAGLEADLNRLNEQMGRSAFEGEYTWDRTFIWAAQNLSQEAQEYVASLIMEPYPDLVDGLAGCMADNDKDSFFIDGSMRVEDLRDIIKTKYAWALDVDWDSPASTARAWYVSAEKLEPRLGERREEPIEDYEQPLATARDVASLMRALDGSKDGLSVADILARAPQYRHVIRRVQVQARVPYAEIRDNTIGADLFPVDMLRCKLSFFGATCFDPRSDRWLRISMFSGAPYPEELCGENCDDWVFPATGNTS